MTVEYISSYKLLIAGLAISISMNIWILKILSRWRSVSNKGQIHFSVYLFSAATCVFMYPVALVTVGMIGAYVGFSLSFGPGPSAYIPVIVTAGMFSAVFSSLVSSCVILLLSSAIVAAVRWIRND